MVDVAIVEGQAVAAPDGWIASNARDGAMWHVARREEVRGERTGKLFAVVYRTRCSGRTLGGAYGQTRRNEAPHDSEYVCNVCLRRSTVVGVGADKWGVPTLTIDGVTYTVFGSISIGREDTTWVNVESSAGGGYAQRPVRWDGQRWAWVRS